MKKYSKKTSKNYLSQILLNTKQYLSNNKYFIKNTNESEGPLNLLSSRDRDTNDNNENQLVQSLEHFSSFNKSNTTASRNYMTNSDSYNNSNTKNNNAKKLFNSSSLSHYQRIVLGSKILSSSEDILPPPLFIEERKNNDKNAELILSKVIEKKPGANIGFHKPKFFNEKLSLCLNNLNSLCEVNTTKKYFFSKTKKNTKNNKKLYNISKNNLLREIILNEYNEKDLVNDEYKKLGDFKFYNKWIKTKLMELKNEIPAEENLHKTFEKEYINSKYYKPLLNLYSLSVSFMCKGKYHLFHIPFEFLPLFYYKNMSYLKYILISIFKFDNNFEDIIIDYDEISNLLFCCKQFDFKNDKNEIKVNKNNEKVNKNLLKNAGLLFRRKHKKMSVKLYNNETKHAIKNYLNNNIATNINLNELYKSKFAFMKKSKYNAKEIKIKQKELNFSNNHLEEKNLYKCIYNKFLFKWYTPEYNYDITVKAPEAVFQAGRIIVRAYIDIELIFYLLENNFKNWDLYISQYIFSYKECHKNMNNLLSIKSTDSLFINEYNSLPLLNNTLSTRHMREIYTNNKINDLNKEKICQFSNLSKQFEFLYTDKNNNNYIKIFHSFFITTKSQENQEMNKKNYCFDFNFYHMRILNKIARIQGLKFFLKKLIYIDRQTSCLKFKYDELVSLANEYYNVLEKYEPNLNGEETTIKMKERNKDAIKITIDFPVLETIKYNNKNMNNCFESDYDKVTFNGISLDKLNQLCKTDFREWPDILLN